jgi:hypothetical protein
MVVVVMVVAAAPTPLETDRPSVEVEEAANTDDKGSEQNTDDDPYCGAGASVSGALA